MKITFVTSFNEDGYNLYGKEMVESAAALWSDDIDLVVGYHDFDIHKYSPVEKSNIRYKNLNDITDMVEYRERMKPFSGKRPDGSYDWRMDAIKWCHKVFCLSDTAFEMAEKETQAGWLIWIDGDTVTHHQMSASDLAPYLNEEVSIVHLGRKITDYSETSFLGFNLNREKPLQLLADFVGAYLSGEVLGYREWHDGFIFERLLNIYKAHGTVVHNLSPEASTLDAFGSSVISRWMTHYKGEKKNNKNTSISPDVNGPKRYSQLLKVVQHYDVSSILETGTWNGGRAIQMAEAAFSTGKKKVNYYGFDLFDTANNETDKVELNTKPHNSLTAVGNRLAQYREKKLEEGLEFEFELFEGDTKETLKKFDKKVDLAYLDGGHSYDTVRNDYDRAVSDLIVFDDYFTTDSSGKKPSDEHCGTNRVIDEIISTVNSGVNKYRVKVLPSQDRVIDGGYTHLAMVLKNDSLPEIPQEFYRVPIVVTPKDCMPDEYIMNNVRTNVKNIGYDHWVRQCDLTNDNMIVVSGGEIDFNSLRRLLKDREKYKLSCVKHALPRLMSAGIIPDYCIILDPRPVTGTSTHGVLRSTLFEDISHKTKFLVASMTDPTVVDLLQEKGADIKLWHAYSEAMKEKTEDGATRLNPALGISEDTTFVTGGTCAAMRTLGLFHVLGFRHFHLFGFDCSIPEITDEQKEEKLDTGQPKYLKVEIGGKTYWTTGELLAMAQDVERLIDRKDIDMCLHFYPMGNSLVQSVYETSEKANLPTYEDIL